APNREGERGRRLLQAAHNSITVTMEMRNRITGSGAMNVSEQDKTPDSDRFDRFTVRARKVMTLAQEEATRFNHNYIGTEHLLLGLVRTGRHADLPATHAVAAPDMNSTAGKV